RRARSWPRGPVTRRRRRRRHARRPRPGARRPPRFGSPHGRGGAPRAGRGAGRVTRPRAEIVYCTQCRWLPRAAWLAQELLSTFEQELGEVALVPGTGGVFLVRVDG